MHVSRELAVPHNVDQKRKRGLAYLIEAVCIKTRRASWSLHLAPPVHTISLLERRMDKATVFIYLTLWTSLNKPCSTYNGLGNASMPHCRRACISDPPGTEQLLMPMPRH